MKCELENGMFGSPKMLIVFVLTSFQTKVNGIIPVFYKACP